jgi:penicillin-binding protein 2
MYHLRLKILILLCLGGLAVAVGRLIILQTCRVQQARQELAELRVMAPQQRPTIRGKILDRSGRTLALDRPAFYLQISYELTRYMDYRWREGKIRRAVTDNINRQQAEEKLALVWQKPTEDLNRAIELANSLADVSQDEILGEINRINDRLWETAQYIYWRRRNPSASWQDFKDQRHTLTPDKIVTVDLYEMHKKYPLIELKNNQDLLRAQVEIANVEGLDIQPQAKRDYPFSTAACHLIGWVAPGQEDQTGLFSKDVYMRYLAGEVLGKSGIEWIYEPLLRGRRGEVRYDRAGNLLERKEPEYGQNVTMTIDIELQRKIEKLLANKQMPHEGKLSAAVVLDKTTNDILAMASIPGYDLNTVRRDYIKLLNDKTLNKPLTNRALQTHYPPGSTAKPLVLIAGLEERKVGPNEAISCTGNPPPTGWPRCLLQREYGIGHDDHYGSGGNTPRNAIRGSCNVFFSRVAHRVDSARLQYWLWQFGLGQNVLKCPLPDGTLEESFNRQFDQSCGSLVFGIQAKPAASPSDLTPLPDYERKWWGIGQGNMRVTVLQAANALAAFTRGGLYKDPRLVIDPADPLNERTQRRIPLSASTISVVRDGMHAVIYESHGTAVNQFKDSDLFNRDMKIFGKTGSTENPCVAWFECFAEDSRGRGVIVVALVEEGQRGAGEAAPLGHEILRYCNEAGYIGQKPLIETPPAEETAPEAPALEN